MEVIAWHLSCVSFWLRDGLELGDGWRLLLHQGLLSLASPAWIGSHRKTGCFEDLGGLVTSWSMATA